MRWLSIRSLVGFVAILAAVDAQNAQAQGAPGQSSPNGQYEPYYQQSPSPPGEPPFVAHLRLGVGLGLGSMSSSTGELRCDRCDFNPVAAEIFAHVGMRTAPNLAFMAEISGSFRQLDAEGATYLQQSMILGAVQFWLTPFVWLKGGLGFAALQIGYDDGYYREESEVDTGWALLAAVGADLLRTGEFTLDIQLRGSTGFYSGVDDKISTVTGGVGFNWF